MTIDQLTNEELNDIVTNLRETRLAVHKDYKQAATQHGRKSQQAQTLWLAFSELHTEAQLYIKLHALRNRIYS